MSFRDSKLKVIAGTAHNELALEIAAALDVPLSSASVGRFPDGEIDIKLHEDMRGSDVFIVQPTSPPVNENIMELMVMVKRNQNYLGYQVHLKMDNHLINH